MVTMNWYGNVTLNSTASANMTVDGVAVGEYKIVDNFSFVFVAFFTSVSLPHSNSFPIAAACTQLAMLS